MSLQDELKAKAAELWQQAVNRALSGADEVKREYADKILALLEEGGSDEIVLGEVEVQLPLVAQALALEIDNIAEEVLKEAARWARVLLAGLALGGAA